MTTAPVLAFDGATRRGTDEVLPAEHGRFSTPFWSRCRARLTIVPDLVEHVLSLSTVHGGGAGDRVQTSRDAPLPFNETAYDDANTLYVLVAYWAAAFSKALETDDKPRVTGWVNDRGRVVGLAADVTPETAREVTGRVADWLLLHLEGILNTDPRRVVAFAHDLELVQQLRSRWPAEERPVLTDLPCPIDRGWIVMHPPRVAGGARRYECESCGHLMIQSEYDAAVSAAADSLRASRVAQHLTRKYGGTLYPRL
ncbi:hypothetical protein LQK89_02625 [Curtobacterium sp. C1]|uniref:hypothetical protein n=1 Tax=Curtobacterium sp. C1 TaxID=2898151 RepID=UPI001E4CFBF2|nr:hypothetical protein [Curtobacterium sp. C1]UFU14613.1 hypothetical protein LQK89_02625 [Curtobacterium sp. C1]